MKIIARKGALNMHDSNYDTQLADEDSVNAEKSLYESKQEEWSIKEDMAEEY